MRSIAELSRKQVTLAAEGAQTDMSTSGITSGGLQSTIWKKEVLKFAEVTRKLDQLIYTNKEMVNSKDYILNVPYNSSHLSVDVSPADGEGGVRDWTEMTNLTKFSFTIATTDFLRGGVSITKQVFMTCAVDLLAQARYTIAEDIADDVDLAVATMLQSTSITTNLLWGGDATQVQDLTAGDVLTTDLIADAMTKIEVNNFIPKYFIISPYQKATLLKDSQFVNASEYGSNEIVMKGEIGMYIGLKVIVVNNANMAYLSNGTETNEAATPGENMNTNIMLGQNKQGQDIAGGIAWKELPHIDYEYDKNEARHKIFYDQAFTTSIMFTEAVSLIKVTQT